MTTDITELAQNPTRYGTNSQGVFTNQTDGAYVSYLDFVALVEALASEKRICATWRKTAEANSEKLEKAQQRIGKLEKKLTDHKRMNQEMAKAMLTPNDSDAAGMEIAALRQRIAELESRTVKLPLPSCTYADHSYPAYSKRQVISLLESLGITVVEGDV